MCCCVVEVCLSACIAFSQLLLTLMTRLCRSCNLRTRANIQHTASQTASTQHTNIDPQPALKSSILLSVPQLQTDQHIHNAALQTPNPSVCLFTFQPFCFPDCNDLLNTAVHRFVLFPFNEIVQCLNILTLPPVWPSKLQDVNFHLVAAHTPRFCQQAPNLALPALLQFTTSRQAWETPSPTNPRPPLQKSNRPTYTPSSPPTPSIPMGATATTTATVEMALTTPHRTATTPQRPHGRHA